MFALAWPRHRIAAVVMIALFAALLCAAPAVVRPQRAQAQGDGCSGPHHNQIRQPCGDNGGNSNPDGNDRNGNNGWNGNSGGNGDHDHHGQPGVTCNGGYSSYLSPSYQYSCPGSSFFQTCSNGSQILVNQSCPQATFTCVNGSVIVSGGMCPTATFTCPNGTVISAGASCPFAGGALSCSGAFSPIGACGGGAVVTYPAGWNLVGAPNGTVLTGASGPLYTLPPGATSYVIQPPGTPLQAGVGYWVFFPVPTTVTLAPASATSTTVSLPPGPFVLIGNPSDTTVSVAGYGVTVLMYDPVSGGYAQTSQLNPGQAAWAASATGGPLVVGVGPFGPGGGPAPPPPPL